ncbi:MAG: hypothetical protein UR94_C0013G0002 [Parcubacteria group bacterium GW2011_GWA2_36_10]|nr:MAG: hypothetical protein UR94_C0013G0002 [Parcubacteria group bacterium GW2011_GWA2_36_10]
MGRQHFSEATRRVEIPRITSPTKEPNISQPIRIGAIILLGLIAFGSLAWAAHLSKKQVAKQQATELSIRSINKLPHEK